MMEMVRVLLRLPEAPHPDHAADALGVAICHANTNRVQESVARSQARVRSGRSTR
jgi:crossover junction endodeoxyribonuclease RuvC